MDKYKKYLIIALILCSFGFLIYDNYLRNELYIDFNYEESYDYDTEFMQHVKGYDEVLFNQDILMPSLVYKKNDKVIGITESKGPEWGHVETRYFFDKNENLVKVINHDDGNEHPWNVDEEAVPDLLVIVDLVKQQTIAYGRTLNGEVIHDKNWLNGDNWLDTFKKEEMYYFAKAEFPYPKNSESFKPIKACNEVKGNSYCHEKGYFR